MFRAVLREETKIPLIKSGEKVSARRLKGFSGSEREGGRKAASEALPGRATSQGSRGNNLTGSQAFAVIAPLARKMREFEEERSCPYAGLTPLRMFSRRIRARTPRDWRRDFLLRSHGSPQTLSLTPTGTSGKSRYFDRFEITSGRHAFAVPLATRPLRRSSNGIHELRSKFFGGAGKRRRGRPVKAFSEEDRRQICPGRLVVQPRAHQRHWLDDSKATLEAPTEKV